MLCVRRIRRTISTRMANMAETVSNSHNSRLHFRTSLHQLWLYEWDLANKMWEEIMGAILILAALESLKCIHARLPLPADLNRSYHGDQGGQAWWWQSLCQPGMTVCRRTNLPNQKYPFTYLNEQEINLYFDQAIIHLAVYSLQQLEVP